MDCVDSMKLSRILKNRKAMTPLMIGIIVAASIIAVIFIVMAAVIPAIPRKVEMNIRTDTIKANATGDQSLKFRVICDYSDGKLIKAEVYKGETLYGEAIIDEVFEEKEEKEIIIGAFIATASVPFLEKSGQNLVFQDGEEYTLTIYYESIDGKHTGDVSQTWKFETYSG